MLDTTHNAVAILPIGLYLITNFGLFVFFLNLYLDAEKHCKEVSYIDNFLVGIKYFLIVPFVMVGFFILGEKLHRNNNYAINNILCGIVAVHVITEVLVVRQYLKW